MTDSYSTVLGASRTLLKVLRVLNIITGVGMVAAFLASFVFAPTFQDFFTTKKAAHIDPAWLLPTLRVWLVLALGLVAATNILLSRLIAMVDTVRAGAPFAADNAARLKTIAWCMLAMQLFGPIFAAMGAIMNAAGSNIELKFSLGDSLTGWAAVLLLFVLARVFEEGARIRADLDAMI